MTSGASSTDAISHGDVLARRTTKGDSAHVVLLNESRDQRMRSPKPPHRYRSDVLRD
jgi:hypothetical protein